MVADTYKSVYRAVCAKLKASSPDSLFEATELCCHFLSVNKMALLTDASPVAPLSVIRLMEGVDKRIGGYPLQYILGEWEFYGRRFDVGEGVLIPRADTETLIDVVLDYAKSKPKLKIADLCSGSGCIAVTLAKEIPDADVHALEKSEEAYPFLLQNINKNAANVTPQLADVISYDGALQALDIVVSNPPYLTKKDMQGLQREVAFEPPMALYGEDDGLYFYREITKRWTKRLKSGGLLAYEIGQGQEEAVVALLNEQGYKTICQRCDLCDIIRVVSGIKI